MQEAFDAYISDGTFQSYKIRNNINTFDFLITLPVEFTFSNLTHISVTETLQFQFDKQTGVLNYLQFNQWYRNGTWAWYVETIIKNTNIPVYGGIDYTTLGISVGDQFVYTVDKYTHPTQSSYIFALIKVNNQWEWLEAKEGSDFSITIDSLFLDFNSAGYARVAVTANNGTHTLQTLWPVHLGWSVTFLDWNYWESNLTDTLTNRLNIGEIDSYGITNGVSEFNYTYHENSVNLQGVVEYRYNKTTGIMNYQLYDLIRNGNIEQEVIRLKSYTYVAKPSGPAPLSPTTSTPPVGSSPVAPFKLGPLSLPQATLVGVLAVVGILSTIIILKRR